MLKKRNLQQVLVYSLAIIVWVNNFQAPKIQQLFHEGNGIAHGSDRGGGWVGMEDGLDNINGVRR